MKEVLERMKVAGARHREFSMERSRYERLITAAYDSGDNEKAKKLTEDLKEKSRAIDALNRQSVFIDVKDGNSAASQMNSMLNRSSEETLHTLDFIKGARVRKPPEDLDAKERKRWLDHEHKQLKIFRDVAREMARAVDLPSPARRGHFLRDFGQSDRDVIENASSHASVPQSLYLLNSPLAVAIHNRNSLLGAQLEKAKTAKEKITIVYRAMLTRKPNQREISRIMADYEQHGDEVIEDLVWALLNSRQFLFIQ